MALLTKTKPTTPPPATTEIDAVAAALTSKRAREEELTREMSTATQHVRDLEERRAALLASDQPDRAAVDTLTREIADTEGLHAGLLGALRQVQADAAELERRQVAAHKRQKLTGLRAVVDGSLAAAGRWDTTLVSLLRLIEEINEREKDLAAVASALGRPISRMPLAELLFWRVWSQLSLPGSPWLGASQRVSLVEYQTRRLGAFLKQIDEAMQEVSA